MRSQKYADVVSYLWCVIGLVFMFWYVLVLTFHRSQFHYMQNNCRVHGSAKCNRHDRLLGLDVDWFVKLQLKMVAVEDRVCPSDDYFATWPFVVYELFSWLKCFLLKEVRSLVSSLCILDSNFDIFIMLWISCCFCTHSDLCYFIRQYSSNFTFDDQE